MHIPRNVRAASALVEDGLDDEADDDLRDRLTALLRTDPEVRRAVSEVLTSEVTRAARASRPTYSRAAQGGRRG
jgi:hypothetical protein